MVKHRLVYTTDEKLAPSVNSSFVDENVLDTNETIKQTITEMNKSKKKGMTMGNKRTSRGKDEVDTVVRLRDMIGFIYYKSRTSKEVYHALFGDDITKKIRFTYLTQLIKYGSDGLVYYDKKKNLWVIDQERKIPLLELVQKVIDNRGNLYDVQQMRERKVKQPTEKTVQPTKKDEQPASKSISFPISTGGKPIELSITIVGNAMTINMKVRVKDQWRRNI